MSLATYTLKMAAVAAPVAALLAFSSEPMPAGWLDGIVEPGSTIGKAAVVLGMWVGGAAATAGGGLGVVWLSWAFWSERRSPAGTRSSDPRAGRVARNL